MNRIKIIIKHRKLQSSDRRDDLIKTIIDNSITILQKMHSILPEPMFGNVDHQKKFNQLYICFQNSSTSIPIHLLDASIQAIQHFEESKVKANKNRRAVEFARLNYISEGQLRFVWNIATNILNRKVFVLYTLNQVQYYLFVLDNFIDRKRISIYNTFVAETSSAVAPEDPLESFGNDYGLLLDEFIIERPNVSTALIARDSAVVCIMLITLLLEDIPLILNINKMIQYQDHFIALTMQMKPI